MTTKKTRHETNDFGTGLIVGAIMGAVFMIMLGFICGIVLDDLRTKLSECQEEIPCEERYIGYGNAYCYPNKNDCRYEERGDGMWDIYEKNCEVIE